MVFLLKLITAFFAALPERLALRCGRGLGRVFGLLVPRNRTRALEALALSFPEKQAGERRAIMWRMFANLGENAVELIRWMGGRGPEIARRIRIDGAEHARGALAQGRGVVVLTAHIGNWDVMGLWAASQWPLTIISKTIRNETLNAYWMRKREEFKVRIVPAHNSYRQCLGVLKRGECLGFILDQNMIRREGIFVEFFGRPACTTPGLAVLSAHAQAPVLPVFMVREADGGHCVQVLPPIPPPPDRTPASIADATQHYTKLVEDAIRRAPDQWIWMHRRWRTQPEIEQTTGPAV